MTKAKKFKRLVRSRSEKTGESYQSSWRQLGGFERVVRDTIKFAELKSRKEDPPRSSTVADILMRAQPIPVSQTLRNHLRTLDEPEVYKLQTLVYVGREEISPLELHAELMARTPDRRDAEATMLSMLPLAEYLRRGLAFAKKTRVDLDAVWKPARPEALTTETPLIKIRPFNTYVERGRESPMVLVTSRIEKGGLIVTCLGQDVEIRTARTGVDRHGSFALVELAICPMLDGFVLELDIDPDPDSEDGSKIRIARNGWYREVVERELKSIQVDPESVNVIHPAETSFELFFDPSGNLEISYCTSQNHTGEPIGNPN